MIHHESFFLTLGLYFQPFSVRDCDRFENITITVDFKYHVVLDSWVIWISFEMVMNAFAGMDIKNRTIWNVSTVFNNLDRVIVFLHSVGMLFHDASILTIYFLP